MNFTLFGYPKTGKTTLFNLLTGAGIGTSAFEDGKKGSHLRTCPVPDQRLERIAGLYPDKNKVPVHIDFIDMAGIFYGETKKEAVTSRLREADGLTHVVRGFTEPRIPPPTGKVDPLKDILAMEEELILTDLVTVETRLEKLERELKRRRSPEGEKERELLERLFAELEAGRALRELEFSETEEKLTRSFAFLSRKPLLHMVNVDEKDIPHIADPSRFHPSPKKGTSVLAFCGKIEAEILELDREEKELFLREYGLDRLTAPRFLETAFRLLGLITFFTIGKKEVKAWTVPGGTRASRAAGVIHTDMEKGFIRAEVITWSELLVHGSLHAAKEKGAVRLEGKDYILQDGDVVYFRFHA